jgi:hypothetical protein
VHGLLGMVGRKNSWQLAEHAGHSSPAGLQNLLSRARWNPDKIRDDLQEYVAERLGAPAGVLIIDDTGFLKKGRISSRCAAPVLRHRRPHRELSDWRLRRLRLRQGPGAGGPGAISAEVLDVRPRAVPGGEDPRRTRVRHQRGPGQDHGDAGPGLTATRCLGDRGLRLRLLCRLVDSLLSRPVAELVHSIRDHAAAIHQADVEDKAEIYRDLGLKLVYLPNTETVEAEIAPASGLPGTAKTPRSARDRGEMVRVGRGT